MPLGLWEAGVYVAARQVGVILAVPQQGSRRPGQHIGEEGKGCWRREPRDWNGGWGPARPSAPYLGCLLRTSEMTNRGKEQITGGTHNSPNGVHKGGGGQHRVSLPCLAVAAARCPSP